MNKYYTKQLTLSTFPQLGHSFHNRSRLVNIRNQVQDMTRTGPVRAGGKLAKAIFMTWKERE